MGTVKKLFALDEDIARELDIVLEFRYKNFSWCFYPYNNPDCFLVSFKVPLVFCTWRKLAHD